MFIYLVVTAYATGEIAFEKVVQNAILAEGVTTAESHRLDVKLEAVAALDFLAQKFLLYLSYISWLATETVIVGSLIHGALFFSIDT